MIYKTLFFDADNTLFDFDKSEREAFLKLKDFLGYSGEFEDFFEIYKRYNESLWKALERNEIDKKSIPTERFRFLLSHFHLEQDPQETGVLFLRLLGAESHLIPGALELVQLLYKHFELVIITNGIEVVQRSRMGASPLKDYFKHVIISESVGIAKPDPAFFKYALEKSQVKDPKAVLVIGDSLSSDILGGMNSGLDTCWYNPKGESLKAGYMPTYCITNFNELLMILNKTV